MSVLACNRSGCENIMCNQLILDGAAYICEDCFEELCAFRDKWPDEEMLVGEVEERIKTFMQTKAVPYGKHTSEIEREFRRLTGRAC